MWEYITGALVTPVQTFRQTAQQQLWKQGLSLVIILSFLRGLVGAVSMQEAFALPPGLEITPYFLQLEAAFKLFQSPLFFITSSFLGGILIWFLGGATFYLIGKLFKGQGTLGGLLAGIGFAKSPHFIQIPLTAVLTLLGLPGKVLSGLIGFGFSIWILVLNVLAVRESLKIGTGAAAATVLFPIALVFFALLLITILVLTLAVATTAHYL